MAKNNKKDFLRPNIMWLWSAITLVIIGYWIFSSEEADPVKITWNKVEQMVQAGDVEAITVVNHEVARVAIKESKVDSLRNVDVRYKSIPEKGYQFFFNIGSVDSFKRDLEEAEAQSDTRVVLSYEKEEAWYDSWLIGLLPWVLMFGIWFFIMRGMRGGGGAGGVRPGAGGARPVPEAGDLALCYWFHFFS